MFHLLGFLALWLGIGQGPGLPPLPQELAANDAVAVAARAFEKAEGDEARQAAAGVLLAALGQADPALQAAYLMACDGAGAMPPGADLAGAWRRLAQAWPKADGAVLAVLRQSESSDRASLRGAIRAAGYLQIGLPVAVQAIAPQLDQPDTGADARAALRRITGSEFASWQEFSAWWEAVGQHGDRAAWLREVLDASLPREVALWRALLGLDAPAALRAIESPLAEVRRLGFEAMKTLPVDTAGAAAALRTAYRNERDPLLRVAVVSLIPRFLQGQEAGSLLDLAMTSPLPAEQLEALKSLARLKPPEEARAGVLRSLTQVYGPPESPVGSAAFRTELLVTLPKVFAGSNGASGAAAPPAEDPSDSELTLLLVRALDREMDPRVRPSLYLALGALRRPAFFDLLRDLARDETRDVADRSNALDALTQIGVANQRRSDLLALLHPLLAHAESTLRYRALRCLVLVGDKTSLPDLNSRLAEEGDAKLRSELLRAFRSFGEVATPEALDPLLRYQPSSEDYLSHKDSLLVQIGPDAAKLRHAIGALVERRSWQLAKDLLDAYPRDGLAEETLGWLDRESTLVTAEWLLGGKLENGRLRDAEILAGQLAERIAAEPAESVWSVLLARLQERRGDSLAAFAAYRGALSTAGLDASQRWPLTLSAVRIAAALAPQGGAVAADAVALLDAAGDPPSDLADEVERLRAALAPGAEGEPPLAEETPPPAPPVDDPGSGDEGGGR